MLKPFKTAIVIGAGAFGTAIANVLANNFERVLIKTRSKEVYDSLKQGKNEFYLQGHLVSSNVYPASDWSELNSLIDNKVELVVSALPTAQVAPFINDNFEILLSFFKKNIPLVSLSKGMDPETHELPDEIFLNFFPEYFDQIMFLSGPSFAKEIMEKQITLVSLAGRSKKNMEQVTSMMGTNYFKCMPIYDIKGLLLGGALKNILAIAGGILEGLGFNHNTRAAMITRGIAEMLRFGKIYNARPETFYGLSGMGDLILTVTGDLSRNKAFGLDLARGGRPEQIIKASRSVIEGHKTAYAAHFISSKYEIRAQIFNGVYDVLYENAEPRTVIQKIMSTPSKFEFD